ncbi:MAG: hypothetical protein U0T69_04950 [Chitinophagales bacterium]
MKNLLSIFILFLLISSCDKSSVLSNNSSKNTIVSKGSKESILDYYQKHTNKYDIGVSLQSTNNTSFKNFGGIYNGYLQQSVSAFFGTNKIPIETIKQMNFKIGDYNLNYDSKYEFNRTTQIGDNQDNNIVNLFNQKNISVNFGDIGASNRITEIGLTNPTPIYFTYPSLSLQEVAPMTNNNSLMIKWNKDVENKNGVIIILSWHGETVSRTKIFPDNDLKVIKTIDDDGEELIDNSMLQYFPDDALLDIAIARGFIETTNINGYDVILESLTYAYEHIGVKK